MIRRHSFLFVVVALLCACDATHHDHGAAEHDDGDAHGHDHGGGVVVTDFTDTAELFVEFPPLAVGRNSPFAAHFTRLDTFAPIASGRVTVRLSGGGAPEETFSAAPSATAGIFRPEATPMHAGERRLTVELTGGEVSSVHDLGIVEVHESETAADAALPAGGDDSGLVPFLKEQQWKLDFATAEVSEATVARTIDAPASLSVPPDARAEVVAPSAGFVVAGERFPRVGDEVAAGEVVFRLVPRLAGGDDRALLRAALAAARAAHTVAAAELARAEALHADGAVAEHRVEEAIAAERTTRAQLAAAEARLAALQGRTGVDEGYAVRAPRGGWLVGVEVSAGTFVDAGQLLARVADDRRLWLVARVAEIDAARLGDDGGAWFESVDGTVIDVAAWDGRLVYRARQIDPVTRTLEVVYAFANPDGRVRTGQSVQAYLEAGEAFRGPVVPRSALVDDAGQDVVFVMADGENWERRVVRTGPRDGQRIGILAGLLAGERVVSRGAYLVHLAAAGPTSAGHGHAH